MIVSERIACRAPRWGLVAVAVLGLATIPVWSKSVSLLPILFGISSLASAVSMIQLVGHDEEALNVLGFAAAACETLLASRAQPDRTITSKAAAFFSGPLPLLMRTAGFGSKRFRLAAAASNLLGSLMTRIAWIEAGKKSASDRRYEASSRDAIGERQP